MKTKQVNVFLTNWQLKERAETLVNPRKTVAKALTAAVSRSKANLAAAKSCSLPLSDPRKRSFSALQIE